MLYKEMRRWRDWCGWDKKDKNRKNVIYKSSGALYGFGFLGALVYYMQQSSSFGEGVIGVLKALVWPAFLVYKLLGI